ncbi:MAG TPA: hypothetical protein VD966_00900 [Pyrinomonadaceae bacterium]|nr:hypothetical protein [Pyrinomonadaceae bacterium]
MSSEQDQARAISERIARRISQGRDEAVTRTGAGDLGSELAAMRASLDELQKRLAQIESHLTREGGENARETGGAPRREQVAAPPQASPTRAPTAAHSPWLSGMYFPATHPSQERFGIEEAAVSELVDYFEREKTCSMEPGSKPCDHCALCSSRGF